jgi:hypothetical protein
MNSNGLAQRKELFFDRGLVWILWCGRAKSPRGSRRDRHWIRPGSQRNSIVISRSSMSEVADERLRSTRPDRSVRSRARTDAGHRKVAVLLCAAKQHILIMLSAHFVIASRGSHVEVAL